MNQRKKQRSACRLLAFSALFLNAVFGSLPAHANVEMHAGGAAGIESGSFDSSAVNDQSFTGLNLSGVFGVRHSYFEGGLGLGYIRWTWSTDNVDATLSQFLLGIEGGIGLSPLTGFRLSSLIGYDFGFYGSVSTKSGSTTVSTDTDGFGRLTHTWRGLYNLGDQLSLGADLKFMRGHVEYSPQSVRIEPEFSAWSLRLFINREI